MGATDPLYPDGPMVEKIEITIATQEGPVKYTGAFGTRMDFSNEGGMLFHVEAIGVGGDRLTLYCEPSYEEAIVEAEEAGKDWEVPVDDLVNPDDLGPRPDGRTRR